ncbi:MAG: basic amino acid/polyamine antiporter, family [Gaiellales bacterium]|jgi:APA family basic amino acid/polyamine antiporter|nr:basic amino acid/polyamine antiporter, family [Gaiellales bacterium]
MARKLPVFQRVVGEDALFAAIYGTISSSLYFALGVVALYALGLTPIVLPVVGLLVLLAAGAYAEAASATGGGSPLIVRRAFGDAAGFLVGWAILLDLLVVALLSALFVPRYAEAAVGDIGQMSGRSAELIGVGVIAALGVARIVPRFSRIDLVRPLALVDMLAQLTLAILGLAALGRIDVLTRSVDLGVAPTWTSLGYALPIALVAFTGIEIVAGLLQEAANPTRPLRRITIGAIAATVLAYAVIAAAALALLPVHPAPGTPYGYASDLSTIWGTAPLAGAAEAIGAQAFGASAGDIVRVLVSVSAIGVLVTSAAIALGAALRTLRALAAMGGLPPPLMRRSRRCGVEPWAMSLLVVLSAALMLAVSLLGREVDALASVYSFGILLAFMLVFASVVALRVREPSLPRVVKMGGTVHFGSSDIPVLALLGLAMSWALWVLDLGTHRAGRILPPAWLACGLVLFVVMRRVQGKPLLQRFDAVAPPPPEVIDLRFGTILVPLKQCGPIEEEMLAIACKLAQEQEGERVLGVNVIEVPLSLPLDAPIEGAEQCATELLQLTAMFSRDYGVPVEFLALRSRAISGAVARLAKEVDAGLILVGAVPHIGAMAGRAQVFSETIENLLRRAPSRVIVTSFPPGTASVATPEDAEPEVRIPPGPAPVA